ncbi:MAG: N-acyl-D-amino-acid deacylase, partial [Bacteroidia bacterium]
MNVQFDILLKNGTIIDGSGSKGFVADVGIKGNVINSIGALNEKSAIQSFDIKGKVLSPGFIDVHTHDDNAVLKMPDCLPKISQGVTTVIVGNCGISAAPVRLQSKPPDPLNLLGKKEDFAFPNFKSYIAQINEVRPAVNVAALVGHTSLRVNHMGDLYREANSQEIKAMSNELRKCLEDGAIGLST